MPGAHGGRGGRGAACPTPGAHGGRGSRGAARTQRAQGEQGSRGAVRHACQGRTGGAACHGTLGAQGGRGSRGTLGSGKQWSTQGGGGGASRALEGRTRVRAALPQHAREWRAHRRGEGSMRGAHGGCTQAQCSHRVGAAWAQLHLGEALQLGAVRSTVEDQWRHGPTWRQVTVDKPLLGAPPHRLSPFWPCPLIQWPVLGSGLGERSGTVAMGKASPPTSLLGAPPHKLSHSGLAL